MRLVLALAVVLLANTLYGQTARVVYELADVIKPEIKNGRLYVEKESVPKIKMLGRIEVPADAKNVRISILNATTLEPGKLEQVEPTAWEIAEAGRWIIGISGEGITTPLLPLILGPTPTPPPGPGPQPDPTPDPPPTPDPTIDIKNDWIGLLAYREAPRDPGMAKSIAKLYRESASMLYGRPEFATIQQVRARIKEAFDRRQCTDQAICEHWGRWGVAVDNELRRLQSSVSSKVLVLRNDWYVALIEIAQALESIR